jgi:chromosome segregation ATPase
VREFAALYADMLAERTDTTAIIRRMEAKMRDDEKRIEGLEARVREAERRAGDAERRASETDRKLEALKQIDKALSDRQNPGAARPPSNGGPR